MKKKKGQLIFPAIKIIFRIIKLSEEALRETFFTGQHSMACYCKTRHFDVHLHTDTSKGDMYLYCLNGKNPGRQLGECSCFGMGSTLNPHPPKKRPGLLFKLDKTWPHFPSMERTVWARFPNFGGARLRGTDTIFPFIPRYGLNIDYVKDFHIWT